MSLKTIKTVGARTVFLKILTKISAEVVMAEEDEIIEVVRPILRFLGSLEFTELNEAVGEEVIVSWTEFERKNSGLGIVKFNRARIVDDSVLGGRKFATCDLMD